jgi:hypothetical protein
VRVRNRETIVIGGMRQREFTRNRAGIPYLMDIKGPIGKLFKNNDVTTRESELIVFLTPEVIDTNYMGREREHIIHGNAVPALDSILHPRIPEKPCPLEDWKKRCGCQHKHKCYESGCAECERCRVEYFTKDAGVPSNLAPQTNPIQVQETTVPSNVPYNVVPETTIPYNAVPEQPIPQQHIPYSENITPPPPVQTLPSAEPQPTLAAPPVAPPKPQLKPLPMIEDNAPPPPPVDTSSAPLEMVDPNLSSGPGNPNSPSQVLTPVKVRSAANQPGKILNPFRPVAQQRPYQDREVQPATAVGPVPQVKMELKRFPPVN